MTRLFRFLPLLGSSFYSPPPGVQLRADFARYGPEYVARITHNRVEDARKNYIRRHCGEGHTNSRQKIHDFVSANVRYLLCKRCLLSICI
jgi:hypothetical protein